MAPIHVLVSVLLLVGISETVLAQNPEGPEFSPEAHLTGLVEMLSNAFSGEMEKTCRTKRITFDRLKHESEFKYCIQDKLDTLLKRFRDSDMEKNPTMKRVVASITEERKFNSEEREFLMNELFAPVCRFLTVVDCILPKGSGHEGNGCLGDGASTLVDYIKVLLGASCKRNGVATIDILESAGKNCKERMQTRQETCMRREFMGQSELVLSTISTEQACSGISKIQNCMTQSFTACPWKQLHLEVLYADVHKWIGSNCTDSDIVAKALPQDSSASGLKPAIVIFTTVILTWASSLLA